MPLPYIYCHCLSVLISLHSGKKSIQLPNLKQSKLLIKEARGLFAHQQIFDSSVENKPKSNEMSFYYITTMYGNNYCF